MESVRLNVDDVMSRTKWKMEIQNYSGQGRSVPYARTQVLPRRFDNFYFFIFLF